jgi:hypothetical protein
MRQKLKDGINQLLINFYSDIVSVRLVKRVDMQNYGEYIQPQKSLEEA